MTETSAPAERKALTGHFPPVGQLFSQSFELFKSTAGKLLGLWLVQMAISIGIILGAVFLMLMVGILVGVANPDIMQQISQGNSAALAQLFAGPAVAVVGIFVIALIFLMIFLSSAFQASSILVVGKSEENLGIGGALTRGFKLALPLFVLSLIVGFITFGSFFLFIIPGIITGVFLSMAAYEVLLEGKKPMEAVKQSVSIVSQNFWSVFGRLALYMVIVVIISLVWSTVQGELTRAGGLAALIGFLINMAYQFIITAFGFAFGITLYRQAKAASEDKPASMTWMWIVTVLGYLLFALMIVSFASAIPKWIETFSQMEQNNVQMDDNFMDAGTQLEGNYNWDDTPQDFDTSDLTPEQQEAMKQLQRYMENYSPMPDSENIFAQ